MLWSVNQEKKPMHKDKIVSKSRPFHSQNTQRLVAILCVVVMVTLLYVIITRKPREHDGEEGHPFVEFKEKLAKVCSNPVLPVPEYKGAQSFFDFIIHPDLDYCYSWLEFGGEKFIIPGQKEGECMDEIRKNKFVCFNEEYEMNLDPCLVYSFTKDNDQQFERDMHMFSCETHVFDATQIKAGEHVKRTEFWMEHAWDISEFPYNKPDSETGTDAEPLVRRRSLDFIAHTLGHEGKVVKLIKSDTEGREWILLKQIISHLDLIDVRQIAIRIHISTTANKMDPKEKDEYFRNLFEILQGLTCAGYKYVMARPAKYYRGAIRLKETNTTYFPSYEINFVKVLPQNRNNRQI